MTDIATLGIAVDTSQLKEGAKALSTIGEKSKSAEKSTRSLVDATKDQARASRDARKTLEKTGRQVDENTNEIEKFSSAAISAARRQAKLNKSLSAVDSTAKKARRDIKRLTAETKKNALVAKDSARENNSLSKSFKLSGKAALGLTAVINAIVSGYAIKQVIDYADTWTLLTGRLKLVTSSSTELSMAQSQLFSIAQRTRGSLEGTIDLYTRLSRTTKTLGLSQIQLATITETINKAIVVSGASSQSAEAAIIQLSQGFAAGALRGEELNSVLEQTPRLASAIARGLGVTIGELRQLGQEGKLTAKAVTGALLKQSKAINAEFDQMPITVAQSMTKIKNSILKAVGELNDKIKFTEIIAGSISRAADAIAGVDTTSKSVKRINLLNDELRLLRMIKTQEEARLKSVKGPDKGTARAEIENRINEAKARALRVQASIREEKERIFLEKDRLIVAAEMAKKEAAAFEENQKRKVAAEEAFRSKLLKTGESINEVIAKSQALSIEWDTIQAKMQAVGKIEYSTEQLKTFSNGAKKAFESYAESAQNAASNAQGFFSRMFSSMESALTNFALTGKLQFKDFANSIIADLMRIAIRQQVTGIFASALGGAISPATVQTTYYPTQTLYEAPQSPFEPTVQPRTSNRMARRNNEMAYVENKSTTSSEFYKTNNISNIVKDIGIEREVETNNISSIVKDIRVEREVGTNNISEIERNIEKYYVEHRRNSSFPKTEVKVIDQRSSSAPGIETNTSRGQDGKEVVTMIVKDTFRDVASSGGFDQTLGINFGSRRLPRRR